MHCDAEGGLIGEGFDCARSLAQKLQEFDALRGRDCLADPGELGVDAVLHVARLHHLGLPR